MGGRSAARSAVWMPALLLVIVVLLGLLLTRASSRPRVIVVHEFLVGAPADGAVAQPPKSRTPPSAPMPPMSFDDLGRGLLSLAQDEPRRELLRQRFGSSIDRGAALRSQQEHGRAARRRGAEQLCSATVVLLGHLERKQLAVLTDGVYATSPTGDEAWASLSRYFEEEP